MRENFEILTYNQLVKSKNIIRRFNSNDYKANYYFQECVDWQEQNYIHRSRFLIDIHENEITGFFSLSLARIKVKLILDEPRIYIPYLWVTNLAVDSKYRAEKSWIENLFLGMIYGLSQQLQKIAGCRFIIMELAKPLEGLKFSDHSLYQKVSDFGFLSFPEEITKKKNILRKFQNKIQLEKLYYDLKDE